MEAIRKCKGTGCDLKTDCYRYKAEDAGPRQLWLEKVPFKHQVYNTSGLNNFVYYHTNLFIKS